MYGKLENYEIEKKIGKGQFSVVYRARCLAVSEESDNPPIVALKKVQIFEMMDAKARLDCMKEIQLLQVLTVSLRIRFHNDLIGFIKIKMQYLMFFKFHINSN